MKHTRQTRLIYKYPNIKDLFNNKLFYERKSCQINQLCAFWNLIGARYYTPTKFQCEICNAPIHKHGQRKYLVCNKCLHRYIAEVRFKGRVPMLYVPKVAVN